MKPNVIPTSNEIVMSEDEFIVSKTDTSGRITYCNRIFMKIAGYDESELLHIQHNIIRHPDMPRGVFRFLWDTLKGGNEFFGYVKNLSADGSYYWVFANVTPDFDRGGSLKGYFSVRRKPSQQGIEAVTPIYREMLRIEQSNSAGAAPDASIQYLTEQLQALGTGYEELVMNLQST